MKRCFRCLKIKPLKMFYKHPQMSDGTLNKCSTCTRAGVLNHRLKNLDRIREYDRKRGSLEHRKLAAKDYRKNNLHVFRRLSKKWSDENKEKRYAHGVLRRAFLCGLIKKEPCFICGNKASEAHHEDYELPLDVLWLCKKHHAERHVEKGDFRRT